MRKSVLTVAVISLFPASTLANCYSILDPQETLVYRSTNTPIDLSYSIGQEMSRRFPGHILIIGDDVGCSEIRQGIGGITITMENSPASPISSPGGGNWSGAGGSPKAPAGIPAAPARREVPAPPRPPAGSRGY